MKSEFEQDVLLLTVVRIYIKSLRRRARSPLTPSLKVVLYNKLLRPISQSSNFNFMRRTKL